MRRAKKLVRDGYNHISDRYLAGRSRDTADVKLLDEFLHMLPPHARILDAGCGAGIPVTQILAERFRVSAVDFAETQIQRARENLSDAEYCIADLTALPFRDDSFQGLVSYYAIIHIPRELHRRLMQDLMRILQPSGLALLCLGASDIETDVSEDYCGAPMYWSHFDAPTNERLVQDVGFEIVWARRVNDETDGGGAAHLFLLLRKPGRDAYAQGRLTCPPRKTD